MNISTVSNNLTATTCNDCAQQRASYLHAMGIKSVLELCVGPSLSTLEKNYKKYNITVTGNDIDYRWKLFYPKGEWIIGDALKINSYSKYDAVIFAPPLSKGCTGTRKDSLTIDQVTPSYLDFLDKIKFYTGIAVMVLPGRSMATAIDRKEYFKLLNSIHKNVSCIPLLSGRRRIVKYYDLVLETFK